MAIRKRNLATGAKLSRVSLAGNAASTPVVIGTALRSSITFNEVGVTIVYGSLTSNLSIANAATIGAASVVLNVYAVKPGATTTYSVATVTILAEALVGSEYTTRDGTMSFVGIYKNAGQRVFPKGTLLRAIWNAGGDTNEALDTFMVWADIEEYGAPPA